MVSEERIRTHPDETGVLWIDGIDHPIPGTKCCNCNTGLLRRTCPKCGGFLHFQGVYSGYVLQCEDCRETF